MNMQIGCNGCMDINHVPEKKHELKIRTKTYEKKNELIKEKTRTKTCERKT